MKISAQLCVLLAPAWLCAACLGTHEPSPDHAVQPRERQYDSSDTRRHVVYGSPSNYLSLIKRLRPGDTLVLVPGVYDDPNEVPGLPVFHLHGEPGRPIVITGPDDRPHPVLRARSTHNTIRIDDASYVVIRNLELDGRNVDVDGVKAQGASHHITLEGLLIRNHGADQQSVGISTKASASHWVIRRNVIVGAGTGMYLGNPDGTSPFVSGLIENNLIVDTIGYNLQIKHQGTRALRSGADEAAGTTVIRHNVFSKAHGGAVDGMARPNVLVGHFPRSGPGARDVYQIYGNFFYQNPTGECLFQGEGNIALYNNLFVNHHGEAVCIQPHNGVPRMVHVFFNTVVARDTGIRVRGGDPACEQQVVGNAVFAASPIQARDQSDNFQAPFTSTPQYLADPMAEPGRLSLFPKSMAMSGAPIDVRPLRRFLEWSVDFNGAPRDARARGAHAGGTGVGQPLRLDIKPFRSAVDPAWKGTASCRAAPDLSAVSR